MNQPHGGPHGSNFDQEQQYNEQQHRLHQMRQQEDLARHEREHNDRQERERQERERQLREQHQPTPPHQNNTGSIPIHQPVASRLPGAIHSPGGLLANHGGAPPAGPLGAPSGPGNAFGGPLHNDRQVQHNQQNAATQQQQHQMFGPNLLNHNTPGNAGLGVPGGPGGFGGALQQQEAAARLQQIPFAGPMTGNSAHQGIPGTALGGQQPILNDALSYLDQVKVQFADQPEVYNKFLDIMKDFKSQSIDTPGVINRVSDLFAGHPNLIQGFNTFLPPGYRIECGTGTDPNTIRVTTPMGTTVQSIPGRAMQQEAGMGQGSASNGYYGAQRPANWQQMPHHSIESPETVFSPQNQNSGPLYAQNQAQQSSYEAQQAAAAAHQREQRGVSQLTNAVAAVGQPPRNTQTPTPGEQAGMNGAQPGMEKRGPVEFNHAISYVNKIKNRFQSQPEIYKQFLEILQTYQRESKPIQDVYRQVTTLFNTAPDLLEDFKQFLPESAAAAKQAQAQKAAEEAASLAAASQTPQGGRSEAKMPPVGTFTASGAKENKKRPRNNPSAIAGSQIGVVTESNVRGGTMGPGAANKRAKLNHNRPLASDAPVVSPTLTPIVPEPLHPHPTSGASSEELAFFDRVKKYIANKQHMNEFLKLCNIFSQDLIDRNVLVQKAGVFIGGNPELMNWFKAFVNYDGCDEVIDNRVKVPTGRVALSNCRGFGPSYRLLPKREREKPCSGRDEMCKSVLNDDWASHPTWASEDSGFVSHRKNIFEESLHRIEEERHDYDFNIEANAKVIQLLEPIAQNIVSMDPAERESFRMPMGLAGQSPAIYRRVLKKIYGERGTEVTLDLFKDPSAVLPVVLARLKQKDEEWRFTQREWEKVWHAQTQAMYLKSLDHMGIHVKQADKKNFAAKHLVDVIKTKHEEQRRQRNIKGGSMKPQFSHEFNDKEVILDVVRIMILYASTASQHNNSEKRRIIQFFERFVSTFFDIPQSEVDERTADIDRGFGDDEEENPPELSNGRGRRPFNGKKNDLRRGVLDKPRNGARGRSHQDGSASGSRESTPDVNSIVDETMGEAADDQAINEVTNDRWTTLPLEATASEGTEPLNRELKSDEPQEREFYSLYCNHTIYVFFTIFHQLYRRLHELKNAEEDVVKEVRNSKMNKAAKEIGLLVETNDYFGDDNTSTYYTKTLLLIEDFITSDIDSTKYEDFLRHYYLKKGWQLYSVADLLKTLCKLGATCNSQDQKEKTPDLMEQFYKNRELRETTMTYDTEINLRKQAAKYIKDGELFHIKWFPTQMEATVQWVHKDDTTFDMNDMDRKQQWQYYISSYVRVEPTEGVNRQHMHPSLLRRNLAADTDSEDLPLAKPLRCVEDLVLRVCVNSYKLIYKNHTQDWAFFANNLISKEKGGDYKEKHKASLANKRERFEEKFVMNNAWMKNMDQDQVQKMKQDFTNWIKPEGIDPAAAASSEMEQ